jgi:hypothetical protein
MMCRLLIIPSKEKKLPDITVAVSRNKRDWQPVEGNILSNRHREYFLHGNQKVSLKWKDMKQSAKKEAGMLKEN